MWAKESQEVWLSCGLGTKLNRMMTLSKCEKAESFKTFKLKLFSLPRAAATLKRYTKWKVEKQLSESRATLDLRISVSNSDKKGKSIIFCFLLKEFMVENSS